MTKIPIFTICILFFASTFYTSKALAVNPEIFARAELGQSAESNELQGLELQAQQEYKAERFASSIELLQRLVVNYTAQGQKIGQARTLRNLGLVYSQTGERSKAEAAIADGFNQLKAIENSAERTKILAQILEVKGQLELSGGEWDKLLETWKQAAMLPRNRRFYRSDENSDRSRSSYATIGIVPSGDRNFDSSRSNSAKSTGFRTESEGNSEFGRVSAGSWRFGAIASSFAAKFDCSRKSAIDRSISRHPD